MASNYNLTGEQFALKDDLSLEKYLDDVVPGVDLLTDEQKLELISAVDSVANTALSYFKNGTEPNSSVANGVQFNIVSADVITLGGFPVFDASSLSDPATSALGKIAGNTGQEFTQLFTQLYFLKYPHHTPDGSVGDIVKKLEDHGTLFQPSDTDPAGDGVPTQAEDPAEGDADVENTIPLGSAALTSQGVTVDNEKVGNWRADDGITHVAWRQPVNQFSPPKTFFYSKPRGLSRNRLGKLTKGTPLLALEMNVGPEADWHKVRVQSETSEMKGKVGYVRAAHTRMLVVPAGKPSPKDIPPAKPVAGKQDLRKGIDAQQTATSWKTRDARPLLVYNSEEPETSTYEITVSTGIQNISEPAGGFTEEQKQTVFEQARIDGVASMLKYYNKDPFEKITLTPDIKSMNDAYDEMAKKLGQVSWVENYHINTSTPNGEMKVLVRMSARHFDSIRSRIEVFDFESAAAETAYPMVLKYKMMKESINTMFSEVLPYYDTEIKKSGMKVVFSTINTGPLKLSVESQKLEEWLSSFNEYLFVNDFDHKTLPGQESKPAEPKDDDIIEIGLSSDFRILYILFNGQPLRTSFNWAIGDADAPGETVMAERRTNRFVLASFVASNDFLKEPENEKTPWTEWVRKNVYIFPKIKPGSAEDNDIKKKIEEANSKPLKTQEELEEETSFFDQFETRSLLASEAEASYTETYDAIAADIDKISKKIDKLETAYYLLVNKYGLEPLIDAIIYCLMQKIPSLEELMFKLGLSELYKNIEDFVEFIQRVAECVPWDILLPILEESFEIVYEKYDEPKPAGEPALPEETVVEVNPEVVAPPAVEVKGDFNTTFIVLGDTDADTGTSTADDQNPEGKVTPWQTFLSSGNTIKFTDVDPENPGKTKEFEIPIMALAGIKAIGSALPWAENLFMVAGAAELMDSGKFIDGIFGDITFACTQTLKANMTALAALNPKLKLEQIFNDIDGNGEVKETEYLYALDFLKANQKELTEDGKIATTEKIGDKIIGAADQAKKTELAILAIRPPEDFFISSGTPTQTHKLFSEYISILQEAKGTQDPAAALEAAKKAELVLAQYVQAMQVAEDLPVMGEGISYVGDKEQTTGEMQVEQASKVAQALPDTAEEGEQSCDSLRVQLDEVMNKLVIAGYIEDIDDWPGDDWVGLGGESMEDWQLRLDLRNQWTECVNKKINNKLDEISNPPKLGEEELSDLEKEKLRTEHSVYAMPTTIRQICVYLDATGEIPPEFQMAIRVRPDADLWGMLKTEYMNPNGMFSKVPDNTMECIADILADLLPKEVIDIIIKILAFAGLLKRFGIMTHNFSFNKLYDPEPDFAKITEDILYQALDEAIVDAVKELTKMLKDACAEEARPNPGAVNLSDAFGVDNPSIDPAELDALRARLRALQDLLDDWNLPYSASSEEDSPEIPDFFSIVDEVAALLTPAQLCSILEGNPSFIVKTAVLELIKEMQPEFYEFFTTDANLIEFMSQIGDLVDPEFCFEAPSSEPAFVFDDETNLCNLDVQEAEKQQLIDKGLTEEEANQKLNENVLEKLDAIDKLNQMRNPDPPDLCALTQGIKKDMSSFQRQLRMVLEGIVNNIRTMFSGDIAMYMPLMIKSGRVGTTADIQKADMQQVNDLLGQMNLTEGAGCDFAAFADFLKEAVSSGNDDPSKSTSDALATGQMTAGEGDNEGLVVPGPSGMPEGLLAALEAGQAKNVLIATDLRDALESENNISIVRDVNDLYSYASGVQFVYPDPRAKAVDDDMFNSQMLFTYMPELIGESDQLDEWSFSFELGNNEILMKNSAPIAGSIQGQDVVGIQGYVYDNLDFTDLKSSKVQDLFADYVIDKGNCNLKDQFGPALTNDDSTREMLDRTLRSEIYEEIMQNMFNDITKKVLGSELFFADQFKKLKFAPELDEILDKCSGADPSSLDSAGILDLLRTEELIEECIERFNEALENGCNLVPEPGEPSILDVIISEASTILLIRTFLIEQMLLSIFSIATFGTKYALTDSISVSLCHAYFREYCKQNQAYSLMKEASQTYVKWLKNNEVYVPATSGEECLKWLFGREFDQTSEDFNKALVTSIPSILDEESIFNPNVANQFWNTFVEKELIHFPIANAPDDPKAYDVQQGPSQAHLIGGATYNQGIPTIASTKNAAVEITNNNLPHYLDQQGDFDFDAASAWPHLDNELRSAIYLSKQQKTLAEALDIQGTFILEPYIRVTDRYYNDGANNIPGIEWFLKEKLGIENFSRPAQFRSADPGQNIEDLPIPGLSRGTYMNLAAWGQICKQVNDAIINKYPLLEGTKTYDASDFPFTPPPVSKVPNLFLKNPQDIYKQEAEYLDLYLAEEHPETFPADGIFPLEVQTGDPWMPSQWEGWEWPENAYNPPSGFQKYTAAWIGAFDYKKTLGTDDEVWSILEEQIEELAGMPEDWIDSYITKEQLQEVKNAFDGIVPLWWIVGSEAEYLDGTTTLGGNGKLLKKKTPDTQNGLLTLWEHYKMWDPSGGGLGEAIYYYLGREKSPGYIENHPSSASDILQHAQTQLDWQLFVGWILDNGLFLAGGTTVVPGGNLKVVTVDLEANFEYKKAQLLLYFTKYLEKNYLSLRYAVIDEYIQETNFAKQIWEQDGESLKAAEAAEQADQETLASAAYVAAASFLNATHHSQIYYGEGGDPEDDDTMFMEPWKIGLRLSYVLPTDPLKSDTASINAFEKKIDKLVEARKALLGGTYQDAPGMSMYKEINYDGENTKEFYVIPIVEQEMPANLWSDYPWSFSWAKDNAHLLMTSFHDSGGLSDFTKLENVEGVPDSSKQAPWAAHLKGMIFTSVEFQTFFKFIFPAERYVSMGSMYTSFATRKIKHMDKLLSSTKKAILAAHNLSRGGGGYEYESPMAGVFDQSDDPSKFGLADYNMAGIIMKFIIKTPFMILKGVAETADPNIIVAKKIIEILQFMLQFYKSVDPACPQVEQLEALLAAIPFPLLSIGLLPSALPYGVGFPPPPLGPGIGPPMTPFGPAYLAFGLWDNSMMNSMDEYFDKKQSDSDKAREAIKEQNKECSEKIEEILYISDEPSEE